MAVATAEANLAALMRDTKDKAFRVGQRDKIFRGSGSHCPLLHPYGLLDLTIEQKRTRLSLWRLFNGPASMHSWFGF